jgi:hypothetical protein
MQEYGQYQHLLTQEVARYWWLVFIPACSITQDYSAWTVFNQDKTNFFFVSPSNTLVTIRHFINKLYNAHLELNNSFPSDSAMQFNLNATTVHVSELVLEQNE